MLPPEAVIITTLLVGDGSSVRLGNVVEVAGTEASVGDKVGLVLITASVEVGEGSCPWLLGRLQANIAVIRIRMANRWLFLFINISIKVDITKRARLFTWLFLGIGLHSVI